ncbi:MAG: hypothetical protein JO187_04680 [Acidobacteria bacterium]|nr:hypothetical protein [Acidobacteriota bacterium]
MFDGLMINNLIAAVERAESEVAAMSLDEMPVIDMPASLLADLYAPERVVA